MALKDVAEYAKQILEEHGCDCYTYGGEESKHILDDLKTAYPDGMELPYIDVANAILAMSRPRPIERAAYKMVWDTDSCCDAIGFDSFGAAKCNAEDTLIEWAMEEWFEWEGEPTEEQKESWDYMVYNCGVHVEGYDPNTDTYKVVWSPSNEELKALGWTPFLK